jgi:hypothetical protein
MFRGSSCPSSGAYQLQQQPLVYRRNVVVAVLLVVVGILETSRIGAPYIYDIRSLRVNDLTVILLTWKKW